MRRIDIHTTLLAACLIAVGCDSGGEAPPDVTVTVVHAAAGRDEIDFLREQRREETLSFGVASRFEFDADTYDFNLDFQTLAEAERTTFTQQILADRDYIFVLTEVAGVVSAWVLEEPEFDPASSNTEVIAVHAAPSIAAVDIYLEPTGTNLSTATPLGNIGFMEDLAPATMAAGDLEVTFTEPGAPANVLFSSSSQTFSAGQSNVIVIIDSGAGLDPLLAVRVAGGGSGLLFDPSLQSGVRVINGAADMLDRDIFANGDFTAPLIPALPFAAPSSYEMLAPGSNSIEVTPAGNPSVSETLTFSTLVGGLYTVLIGGDDSAGLSMVSSRDDRRPRTGEARLTLLNAANQYPLLGVVISDTRPNVNRRFPDQSATIGAPIIGAPAISFPPGTYDVTVQDPDTSTVVGGPESITLSAGGVYGVLTVNGADASTVDVVFMDDVN